MNEMLKVYLDTAHMSLPEKEALLKKIGFFVQDYGVKYSGISNLYIPVVDCERDNSIYEAQKALHRCEWLKGILLHTAAFDKTDVCLLDEIIVRHMSRPSAQKYDYYEQYYTRTGNLPHRILVDENRCLRDGYISYLLAQKYHLKAEICEVLSTQPSKKIVIGRIATRTKGSFLCRGAKRYMWIYDLRSPVIPGDILVADTKKGKVFVCAESIGYLTGEKFCAMHRRIRRHVRCEEMKG